jgi:monoamine oxidase
VITAIDYSGTKVKLAGKKNPGGNGDEPFSAEADKVIVAVPVSILKRGEVSFIPSLPSVKTTALNNIGMDAAIRFVIDFKQNFWGTSIRSIFGGTQAPEYFNAGVSRSEFTKTLSVTVYGPQAEALSALPPDTAVLHILAELDQVYGGKATANVRKDGDTMLYEVKDWSKEQYIRGGMSYLKPGGTADDRTALGQSISDVLFFAGEACDDQGEAGTINGALLSAERVAGEVIDTIVKA